MTGSRRRAREWAVQMLVAADLNPPAEVPAFLKSFWEELVSPDDESVRVETPASLRKFAEERVVGVLARQSEIDAILVPLLTNWDLFRLGTVERAVLRLGIWEMTYTDVPKPVVINEAIDLANWFSTPKSRSIVNGVLDRYAKSL